MDSKKLIGVGFSEMGEWWIADNPQNKQIGMLKIDENKNITVSLYNAVDKKTN